MSYSSQQKSNFGSRYGGSGDRFSHSQSQAHTAGYTGSSSSYNNYNPNYYGNVNDYWYGYPNSQYPQQPRKSEELDPEDEQFHKMFIGGLSLDTNDNELTEYFSTYGDVVDAVVMKDPNTKRSRCFGFVTFKESKAVNDVQEQRPHKIKGKLVESKRAMRKEDANNPEAKACVKKVFLGGINRDASEQEIKDECEKHGGQVECVEIIKNKQTGEGRGFCFVSFSDADSVDKIFIKKFVDIKGKKAEVKKAQERTPDGPGRGNVGLPWQDFYSGRNIGQGRGSANFYSGPVHNQPYSGGYGGSYRGQTGYSGNSGYMGSGQMNYGCNYR